ncbi:MAG: hypothetical protein DMF06_11575, partial [Verrucomicrobia bacterium]
MSDQTAGTIGATGVTTVNIVDDDGPRYVGPGGNDTGNSCVVAGTPCATIAHAIAVANPGETIHIAAGEYTEFNIVVDKDLT